MAANHTHSVIRRFRLKMHRAISSCNWRDACDYAANGVLRFDGQMVHDMYVARKKALRFERSLRLL
jgi:hypothetical protein